MVSFILWSLSGAETCILRLHRFIWISLNTFEYIWCLQYLWWLSPKRLVFLCRMAGGKFQSLFPAQALYGRKALMQRDAFEAYWRHVSVASTHDFWTFPCVDAIYNFGTSVFSCRSTESLSQSRNGMAPQDHEQPMEKQIINCKFVFWTIQLKPVTNMLFVGL